MKMLDENGIEYKVSDKGGILLDYDNEILRDDKDIMQHCYRTRQTTINPIVDWTESDVWEFLRYYGCSGNPLYQCGKGRIGCIGCPMQGKKAMKSEFFCLFVLSSHRTPVIFSLPLPPTSFSSAQQ